MERWEEEVEILTEEFKRTYRTFIFLSKAWLHGEQSYTPGKLAYAHERSTMYCAMAQHCKEIFYSIEGADHSCLALMCEKRSL